MIDGGARAAVILLPLLLACGGEANDAEGAGRPQYAVVLQEDFAPRRVFSISTLEAQGSAELAAARQQGGVEYPDTDLIFPWLREGTLLRFPEDRQSFTEILVDPSGAHQPGDTYSIAELGAQPLEIPFSPIPISPDEAYLFDWKRQHILVWDLAAMAPRALLPLGLGVAPGYTSLSWTWLPVVDDRLTLLTHSSSAEGAALDTIVTVIDVESDAVLSQQLESRCTGLGFAYESASGDRYFATSAGVALRHLADPERHPAPCVLRILAGQVGFDPSWQGSLSAAVGSRAWGSFSRQVGGGLLLLVAPEREAQRLRGGWLAAADAEIWQLWLVQPDGSGARQLSALPPMNTQVFTIADAERRYLWMFDPVTLEQRYTNITDLDAPRPAISLPPRTNAWRIRSIDFLFP